MQPSFEAKTAGFPSSDVLPLAFQIRLFNKNAAWKRIPVQKSEQKQFLHSTFAAEKTLCAKTEQLRIGRTEKVPFQAVVENQRVIYKHYCFDFLAMIAFPLGFFLLLLVGKVGGEEKAAKALEANDANNGNVKATP